MLKTQVEKEIAEILYKSTYPVTKEVAEKLAKEIIAELDKKDFHIYYNWK